MGALRMKKKLEADVGALDVSLEHANAANIETQKTIKVYHQKIRDSQQHLEDEQRAKEVTRDHLLACERKSNTAQELSDTNEQLSEMTCFNQSIAGAKRKLESEMETLHGDCDEMVSEASLSEEKCKKAMIDAARLADELRSEQELALNFERDRKLMECQVKDMAAKLDESETNALKGGKKAMLKMETRIRELESETDAEARRMADAQKNLRKSERRIKEMTYGSDEDRKNHERMQALIDQLQSKIKSYKKQIEEAEEIAALNLAKYRNAHAQLSDAEERADLNEQSLAKTKTRGKSVTL